jgi:hypothetical protein
MQLETGMSEELKPLTVTIKTAKALSGLGSTKLYELIGQGVLSTKKAGTRTLIRYSSLESYLNDDRSAAA